MPPFGFALVGCGMIARFHARAILEIPGARVAALVSRTPANGEKLIQETGIPGCPTLATLAEALNAPGVDARPIGAGARVEHGEPIIEAA